MMGSGKQRLRRAEAGGAAGNGTRTPTPRKEQAPEIARLRREFAWVRMERDTLRELRCYFGTPLLFRPSQRC
jgi:transposase-like protein